jgi:hypothetical protein
VVSHGVVVGDVTQRSAVLWARADRAGTLEVRLSGGPHRRIEPVRVNEFREELERTTAWRYSGGTDLVPTNAIWDAAHRSADLDFSSALAMNLEQAIADGAIPDAARWFERIFRFAESSRDDDPTWGFGASAGLVAAQSGLLSAILSLLPGSFGSEVKKLPHFVVADLAR